MEDFETQDRNLEYLKSFYEEDFEDLADKVWQTTNNPDGVLSDLEEHIDNLLEEFTRTCEDTYGITDSTLYFELLLAEFDLPSLLEYSSDV